MAFAPELLLQAQGLSVVFLDVDGVLTDGGLYFSGRGETLKRFDTQDGLGLKMLLSAGFQVVVVSGRDSRPLRQRVQALGLTDACFGVTDKVAAAQSVLTRLGRNWSEAVAMGDDWPDLALMRACALAIAPANAHAEVRALANHVTARAGGAGAVRELCDLLLLASGRYAGLLREALA
jgi:3-deoxy-D-manno-octulosonate 8-phosphate phosphatase (KDO 8-P phosphatase)